LIYDYDKEKFKKMIKGRLFIGAIALFVVIALIAAAWIYLEIIQLKEIGKVVNIYVTNLFYKVIFSLGVSILIFMVLSFTNVFIKRNISAYFRENDFPQKRLPNFLISLPAALIGGFLSREMLYQKALSCFNATSFNLEDPLFSKDISYYILQRPFFTSLYELVSALWLFIIFYTVVYYLVAVSPSQGPFSVHELKNKRIMRHNLINIAVFFIIKTFSYKFLKEGILYSSFLDVKGAGYVDVNVWLVYYSIAPFLLILIGLFALIFIIKGQLKKAVYAIAVFPAVWLIVSVIAYSVQSFVVGPNEFNMESQYLKHNIKMTRVAFGIDKTRNYEFSSMQELSPEIINRNPGTRDNIRIVDLESTLLSNIQLQSNTNFYTFNDGDIINYPIDGKDTPVFIAAREIDKKRLPDKSYLNTTYKYTHGYGIVINPINRITSKGQIDYILSGLRMKSEDPNLKILQPQIYYGELTQDHVIVNASNNLDEIDYDGNSTTRYKGKGGIKLNLLNRLLFSLKYGDFNMFISGYANNATLLLNREIISRAQKGVPFLKVDEDPYIVPTADGRLKWVLNAYTTSDKFPYSESYGDINYIRNSVKIIIDAYDGSVEYYIIDKNDPLIMTYRKIYPGVFTESPLPSDIAQHLRYPETLFEIQTEMLKSYHVQPDDVSTFYSKQDLWDIAKYSTDGNSDELTEIEPYYNMIVLPGNIGQKEELILMRPFTPSGELKHNMVSWLAVRNSYENYGEMILFTFPKNTNIFGPYQVEVKINQIDEVSKNMTLWGQSGSSVYKGSLLVIPIENSVLYVEPIYIRAAGTSSIPEIRQIIVGYQSGDEFKYGIGANLDDALNNLFGTNLQMPPESGSTQQQYDIEGAEDETVADDQVIDELISKYDEIQRQLDELGDLISKLKEQQKKQE